jgi:uncharacterized protein (TIGR02246 family)
MKNRIPKLVQRWVGLIEKGDPKQQAKLYSRKAVLLATFEPMLVGRKAIYGYMQEFLDKPNMECEIVKNVLQIDKDKDTKIASGIYIFTFDNEKNRKRERVVARYTFVLNKGKIINHHSSVYPEDN